MNDALSIDVLNRLLAIEYRSLPMYLAEAALWRDPAAEQASAALANIVLDQRNMAARIAEMILDRRGRLDMGEYPMDFTDTHCLSLDFLLKELIHYQRQDVAAIEECVTDVVDDAEARALAEEVLGSQRRHLEVLEELLRQPAAR
jgi:hypothetical protein